jgi:alginate O-acetyltransferase complex protein AlgI
MLAGGLWHGANWTFLVWGLYHGALLAIERALGVSPSGIEGKWSIRHAPRWLVTFLAASVGWVFFRARSLRQAREILGAMFHTPLSIGPIEPALLLLVGGALSLAILAESTKAFDRLRFASPWVVSVCGGILLFVTELFATGNKVPFIYFQF